MGPFGLVELERPGEAFEDAVGDASGVPALEAGVVVDADAGEQGDLLAAQARDPAVAAVVGQAGLLRGDLGPAGGQELTEVGPVVHKSRLRAGMSDLGGPASTWNSRPCRRSPDRV